MSPDLYEHISLQISDPIIEWKTCPVSGQKFAIFQKDREFLDTISPTFAGQKFVIPNPILCPEERQARRLMQRNERNFYKSTCALTGKSIITNINPKLGEPVYDTKVRRWDGRDARDCGQDRDPSSSFFSQFHALRKKVPKIALMNDNGVGNTNCEYTYDFSYGKDCYMSVEVINSENCYFCVDSCDCKFMIDCATSYYSNYCIECNDSYKLYNCAYVSNSSECTNVLFARDCKGCSDCIGCVGLRNTNYHIFNKKVTKEEFIVYKESLFQRLLTERDSFLAEWQSFLDQQVKLYANFVNADGCSGNNLFDCAEMHCCFDMKNSKNCRYFFLSANAKDSMDITISCPKWRCYEWVTPDFGRKVCFSTFCRRSTDVRYSEMCHRCTDCFGCVGLKDKQYCIFNKQYTKEEYDLTVAKIIDQMIVGGEWWEYFPAWTSSHPYNKSDAMQRYPLTKEQGLSRWYARDDEIVAINIPEHATTIEGATMDTNPLTVSESIVDSVIICAETQRPYRIIKAELDLYRKIKFPLPRLHHDVRHQHRMARRLWRSLYLRTCPVISQTLITPYSTDYLGIVLSKEAYEKEIYG